MSAAPRWLVATSSRHKVKEIQEILAPTGATLVLPGDVGVDLDVDEWGSTFATNAALKAVAYAQASGLPCLADDSGIEVDALDGRPGVHSARFAGGPRDDDANNARLLRELANVAASERTARYRCVIALARPTGEAAREATRRRYEDVPADGASVVDGVVVVTASGACEGSIGFEARGSGGFGYDPFFVLPDGRHMAELPPGEKHAISHRGAALRALLARLV